MYQMYYWDKKNNNWFIRSKTETDYDVYGNEVMYKHYYQNWGGNGLKPWFRNEYIYDLSYSKGNLIMPQRCYYTELLENNIHLQIEGRYYFRDDEKPHNVTKVLLFTSICERK